MKFVLLVEGYTEKYGVPAFLKRYLDPRLRVCENIGLQIPNSKLRNHKPLENRA